MEKERGTHQPTPPQKTMPSIWPQCLCLSLFPHCRSLTLHCDPSFPSCTPGQRSSDLRSLKHKKIRMQQLKKTDKKVVNDGKTGQWTVNRKISHRPPHACLMQYSYSLSVTIQLYQIMHSKDTEALFWENKNLANVYSRGV